MFSPTGAVLGALAGGVAGGIISQENGGSFWKGAAIGATIGGAVCGIVGGIGDNPSVNQEIGIGKGHGWNSLRKSIGIEGRYGKINNAFTRFGRAKTFSGEMSGSYNAMQGGTSIISEGVVK